jgi:hypothetical protein
MFLRFDNRVAAGVGRKKGMEVARPRGATSTVLRTVAMVAAGAILLASPAACGSVTDVSLSGYYNGSWASSAYVNGSQIFAAPTTGNTGSGLTFADWNGHYVYVGPDNPSGANETITLNLAADSLAINNNTTVNALLNLIYGEDGAEDAIVSFSDSHGDTKTFDLYGNNTIRDYNNNLSDNHSNGLSGSDPGVTALNWWNNCTVPTACSPSVNYQRLDAQTFTLPASWAGYTLTSMTITDPWTGSQSNDVVLSALQVDQGTPLASTPEPGSLALLLGGLAGVGIVRRRRSGEKRD